MNLDSFKTWLDAYGRAWENRDPQAAVKIFAADATYRETPFDETMRGHKAISKYWAEDTRTQEDIKFSCEILTVSEGRGIAHWKVSFARIPSKAQVKLDGIFVAYFNAENLCTVFEEWWHREETESL